MTALRGSVAARKRRLLIAIGGGAMVLPLPAPWKVGGVLGHRGLGFHHLHCTVHDALYGSHRLRLVLREQA